MEAADHQDLEGRQAHGMGLLMQCVQNAGPEDGVLVARELLYEGLCPLLPAIHYEGQAQRQAPYDLHTPKTISQLALCQTLERVPRYAHVYCSGRSLEHSKLARLLAIMHCEA